MFTSANLILLIVPLISKSSVSPSTTWVITPVTLLAMVFHAEVVVAATTSALLTVKPYAVVIVLIEKPNKNTAAIYVAMNTNVL